MHRRPERRRAQDQAGKVAHEYELYSHMHLSEFARGWRVLVAGTLGMSVMTTSIPFYTFGVFVRPLELANGWSRTQISVAASVLGLLLPLGVLYAARSIDRVGVRRVAAQGHLALGLMFLCLSSFEASLWLFWGGYAAAALLAAGASPVAYTRPLVASFDRHRGLALGICISGAGIGAIVAPPALEAVIRQYGWSAGYAALGIAILTAIPFALWLLPEAGEASGKRDLQRMSTERDDVPNASEVSRSLLLWLCIVFFVVALAVNGLVIHFVPLLIDAGMTSAAAAGMAGLIGIAVIAGRIVVGLLLDKISAGRLAAALFAATAVSLLLLVSYGVPMAPLAAVAIGITVGGEVDFLAFLVSRAYAGKQYVRNYSRVYSAFMLGTGVSPVLGGWIHDELGTYDAYLIGASAGLAAIAIFFLLRLHTLMRPASLRRSANLSANR